MKRVFMQLIVFLSLIFLNNNVLYGDIIKYPNGDVYEGEVKRKFLIFGEKIPNRKGKLTYISGIFYEGNWENGKLTGQGKCALTISHIFYEGNFKDGLFNGFGRFNYIDNTFYEGNFIDDKRNGQGKFTVVNKTTKKPLYTQVYDKKGIMKSVEYLFKEKQINGKLVIDYDGINRALNKKEINEENRSEYLKKYIKVFNENNNEITNYDDNIEDLVKQCAQYQMQSRLKGETNELDDEKRMKNGHTGLQNLIVLSQTIDNISNLKRTRFEIEQNNTNWPANIYRDIELYLNSLGLTKNDLFSNDNLASIHNLDTNYLSVNMVTTTKSHGVSGTIDLNKLRQNGNKEIKDFIYIYDSDRIVDNPNEKGDLGGLQSYCQFYNHVQQKLGSCWYHASCSTITVAEHPKIIEGIRNGGIKPIDMENQYFVVGTKPNNFEVLQMIKLQKVAEDLGVERLGYKTERQEFTESGNRPRMIYQILNYPTRNAIKNQTSNETGGTYKSLLFIAKERGLSIDDLDSDEVKEELLLCNDL